jgi:hypothetical protein
MFCNKKIMNKELEKALRYDSLAEAEKITGKYSGEDESTVFLGMALGWEHNQKKSDLLKANNDTGSFDETFDDVLDIIRDLGFVEYHRHQIKDTDDILCVFWRDGILLRAESFTWSNKSRQVVNSLDAYFFYQGSYESMPPCSCGRETDDIWHVHIDGRDGLRFNLSKFEAGGKILKLWLNKPFLWLVDYQQKSEKDYNHKKIANDILDALPIEIQRAICHEK